MAKHSKLPNVPTESGQLSLLILKPLQTDNQHQQDRSALMITQLKESVVVNP